MRLWMGCFSRSLRGQGLPVCAGRLFDGVQAWCVPMGRWRLSGQGRQDARNSPSLRPLRLGEKYSTS